MSESSEKFIAHLQLLKSRNRGALAAMRRSLAFEPGTYPPVFPHVERFAGSDTHEQDSRRLALYAVAALYASYPEQQSGQSFATAFGELMKRYGSASIEQRFVALLEADAENIFIYLKQAVSLLAAKSIGCDYARLLDDLSIWMNPSLHERRDQLRQRWARDFYRALSLETETIIAE